MTPESLHNQAIRKRPLVGARGLYSSFLVLLGYTIGFGHGTWTSSNLAISTSTPGLYSSKGQEFRLDRCQSADATSADKWQGMDQHEGTGDGWKSIHVFYGNRSHLIKHKIETSASFAATNSSISKTELSLAEPLVEGNNQNTPFHEWYSQARQDEIVVALFGGKTGGYYVDLAANDATHWSNTYALEQGYQWNGLCIEPNPWYWKNLSYRTCTVVAAVVGGSRSIGPRSEVQNQQRNNTEVYFRFDAGTHGGIADEGFDNNRRWQKHSQLASTVPLLEIFFKAQAPRQIDYLSLDVEGAETLVLLNFPLNQYRIHIITAERLKGPIRAYLKTHGYVFIQRITRWGESLWIHNESMHLLDMDALGRFSFPIL